MRNISLFFFVVMALLFSACTGKKKKDATTASAVLKVGMVTDSGSIDDKSFNQGTWQGILDAASASNISEKYLKPSGTTEADYIKEIGNLYDAGYTFIITPGFKFETAIFTAQESYSGAKFVLIDGTPHAGDFNSVVGENTVSIFFAEHESGFLAGVATALQLGTAEVGFIGGMEIPPVQKFNWGFQQGIAYANAEMGSKITIKPENFVYQGSFDNVAAGQQLAAGMFDKGVQAIFCAAGGVGVGAINEAKARARSGEDVWIIGVDVDQYEEGLYDGDKSIILTSAMKKIDTAAYEMIQLELENKFPGGETLLFDSSNNGVGIPDSNPNLDAQTESAVARVSTLLKEGSITVSSTKDNLIM